MAAEDDDDDDPESLISKLLSLSYHRTLFERKLAVFIHLFLFLSFYCDMMFADILESFTFFDNIFLIFCVMWTVKKEGAEL